MASKKRTELPPHWRRKLHYLGDYGVILPYQGMWVRSIPLIRRPMATLLLRIESISEEREVVLQPVACFFYNISVPSWLALPRTLREDELIRRYAPTGGSRLIVEEKYPLYVGLILKPPF